MYDKNRKGIAKIDTANTATKATVKIGINITLATIEIMFNVLKKYAIINIIETVVEMLIARGCAIGLGIFNLFNAL